MADNPSISTSEGFESDNNAAGGVETPQTSAIFSNITLVGPLRGNSAATVASGFRRGARIRRNSALKIYNSIFMDFSRGLHIDGGACENNATNGSLKYMNNINAGYKPNFSVEKNSGSSFAIKSWYGLNNNDSISLSSGILVNPYGDNSGDFKTNLDFRPVTGSVALSNYAFNDSEIISFVINAPTTASATIEYCVGETATALTATAKSDCTLKWYNVATGGSSISTPTPSTVSAGTTTYYVSQANAAGTEGPRTLITVIVHANPTAPVITANGPTSLCTGSSVDLSSNQVSNNVWSTSATTQTITVNTSGTYSVVYTDANQCSATSNTITINVSNAPLPTVQVSGSLSLCQGDSVELTASTSDSYLWSNGETTQSIYVNTAATYYVTTTNANACNGVGQSANSVVTVAPQPTAGATFVITNGNTVAFTNTSTSATSYSWDFGDFSSSSAPSPTHVFLDFNDYTVVLTAINGGCQDTAVFSLTTLSVKEIANDNSTFVSIFPNPMSEMGTILVDVKEYSPISIVITDNKGAIVNEVLNQNLEAGKHSFSVDTNNFENGLYYVIVRTSKSNNITKINVIK